MDDSTVNEVQQEAANLSAQVKTASDAFGEYRGSRQFLSSRILRLPACFRISARAGHQRSCDAERR